MNTFEKIINVMARNIFYTVILAIAIVLFAIFSDGLLAGLITAASALIAYVCIELLYKDYVRQPAVKTTTATVKTAKAPKAKTPAKKKSTSKKK